MNSETIRIDKRTSEWQPKIYIDIFSYIKEKMSGGDCGIGTLQLSEAMKENMKEQQL